MSATAVEKIYILKDGHHGAIILGIGQDREGLNSFLEVQFVNTLVVQTENTSRLKGNYDPQGRCCIAEINPCSIPPNTVNSVL